MRRIIRPTETGFVVVDVKKMAALEAGLPIERVFGEGAFELPEDHEARHIPSTRLLEEYELDGLPGGLRKKTPES